MTHYIIDSKKRQEYLAIFFSFIVVSFGLGYTFGYLHGTPAEEITSVKQVNKTSPADKPLSNQATTIKKPESKTVTKPSDKKSSTKQAQQPQKKKSFAVKKNSPPKQIKNKPVQNAKPIIQKQHSPPVKIVPSQKSSSKSVETIAKTDPEESASKVAKKSISAQMADTVQQPSSAVSTSESADKNSNQYLVQVGLFSSRDNASTFVAQLKEEDFKAFLSAFTSSNGDEQYNVRLGPFVDKDYAQKEMTDFRDLHKMPAYILTQK